MIDFDKPMRVKTSHSKVTDAGNIGGRLVIIGGESYYATDIGYIYRLGRTAMDIENTPEPPKED